MSVVIAVEAEVEAEERERLLEEYNENEEARRESLQAYKDLKAEQSELDQPFYTSREQAFTSAVDSHAIDECLTNPILKSVLTLCQSKKR